MKKLTILAGLTLCMGLTACARDGRYDYRYDNASYPGNSAYDSSYGYSDRVETKARMWFNKADTNGDGYVSRSESRAFGERMFRKSDTNRDGRVSFDECLAQKHREWMKENH